LLKGECDTGSSVDEGEEQLGNAQLEEHMKAKYNSVGEGKVALGGIANARKTFIKLQETLYRS